MKRMISLLLALTMLLPAASCAAGAVEEPSVPTEFSDVPADADYAAAVTWCREEGLMQGVSQARFDPEGTLTRAMTATILYRAAGEPETVGETGFSDVPSGRWYSSAIIWANARGIVKGYGNGTFGTEDPVSREQLDIMIRRYNGEEPVWTGDAALALPATRAEAAVAFYSGLDQEGKEMTDQNARVLVAYFSCTNNTEKIAQHIKDALGEGADLYRIEAAQPYTTADLNYNTDCRANREQEDTAVRPAIRGGVEDMDQYDVVFLGYPIWWGRSPKIIYTFLESYDWTGKTIVPFCTSGSSPYSDSGIRDLAQGADWLTGRRFSGSAGADEVKEWVETLDLPATREKAAEEGVFYIAVNGQTLTADFSNNSSAQAFRELLTQGPVSIEMDDYGGFEKVGPLGTTLPRNDSQITTEPGDVILYQGNSVTIYYDRNSWNFTCLGKIRGMTQDQLKQALGAGAGSVRVTFSLTEVGG